MSTHAYIDVYVRTRARARVCVCVRTCVCERERKKKGEFAFDYLLMELSLFDALFTFLLLQVGFSIITHPAILTDANDNDSPGPVNSLTYMFESFPMVFFFLDLGVSVCVCVSMLFFFIVCFCS